MKTIAIIGLGYVGLPLAVEFGKQRSVIGYDIDLKRIDELNKGYDRTNEVDESDLGDASGLKFTGTLEALKSCQYYIVTVPTPIDNHKKPDLRPLENASAAIGSLLQKGDIVIYESTVFPGCTEDVCVPTLEAKSGLVFMQTKKINIILLSVLMSCALSGCFISKIVSVPMRVVAAVVSIVPMVGNTGHEFIDGAANVVDDAIPF